MQAIASQTVVRPQFVGAKKSFTAKKVRVLSARAFAKMPSARLRAVCFSPATGKSRVPSHRARPPRN
jgi:hypothetical protein